MLTLPPSLCATAAELKLLPGCGTADWARYEATATSAECREWDGKATLDPCPPSCQEAFTAVRALRRQAACADHMPVATPPSVSAHLPGLLLTAPAHALLTPPLQLGEECYARVAEFTWQRLGVMAEPATLALYV